MEAQIFSLGHLKMILIYLFTVFTSKFAILKNYILSRKCFWSNLPCFHPNVTSFQIIRLFFSKYSKNIPKKQLPKVVGVVPINMFESNKTLLLMKPTQMKILSTTLWIRHAKTSIFILKLKTFIGLHDCKCMY